MKKILWIFFALWSMFCVLPFSACKKSVKSYAKYEITAEYIPDHKTLTGAVKVTFENVLDKELSVLKFQLYPNAYRKDALYQPISSTYKDSAYYAGDSYGEISISSVHGSKNWEIAGEDGNILYVYLERVLSPGDKVVLDIGFITRFAEVNHRTGVTKKTVNFGNFYPILCGFKDGDFYESVYYSDGDPFYSDCSDYKVHLTVPKEYTVAATGEIVSERMLESKKVYSIESGNVRDFACVLSDCFRVQRSVVNGTEIAYYYYADESPKDSLKAAEESFAFYEKTFGEYPYSTYTVAETGFCFGGMEYPRLSMISDSLSGKERVRAIAHETAHQWWYGVVGSDQTENAWQDEGLTEYSTLLFFEEYEKYGFTRESIVGEALKEYRSYYDVYGSVLGRTDTRMTRPLSEYISEYEYRCISYDKAVIMFDTLRKSVGEKKFATALSRYYKNCRYTMAGTEDIIINFEKTGLDVRGFFESFLDGKAVL